jgi:uncharacterized protein (TIGR04141 family)
MNATNFPLQALTIYLLRELQDPRKALVRPSSLRRIDIDDEHSIYIKKKRGQYPSWATFFSGRVNPDEFGKVRSSGALLLCEAAGRYLAVTFGTGRYLLDPMWIEQRFGLLVTLNTVDPRRVRSIDTASLDRQGMQSRTQASRDASARDFGLDIEQDLVRAVAGTPLDGLIGETIAGFDSLHVNARIDFSRLRGQLERYLQKSKETTYQQEFGWIDHVRDIRDESLADRLTRHVVREIKRGDTAQIWLAPDGIIDWNDVSYFQFGGAQSASRYAALSLDRFVEHSGGAKALTLDDLRTRIRALRADDSIAHEWPVARCLQAEVQLDRKSYLLSAGKWYQIDEGFVEGTDKIVAEIPTVDLGLPEYEDKTEGDYNKRVVRQSQGRLALLDADTIRHGGSRSQIEFCDLYSCDRDLIHLKRYSSSATLSHLFSQATVSAQNFKSDIEFRQKVNLKLPPSHQIPDTLKPLDQDQYRVVIGIIGGPATSQKLPFFSRVTLKNSYKQLMAYGYRVAVSHIPLEENFARLAVLRERVKRQGRVKVSRPTPPTIGGIVAPIPPSRRIGR